MIKYIYARFIIVLLVLSLGGCALSVATRPQQTNITPQPTPHPTPPRAANGIGVALLLPLSDPRREIQTLARDMFNAAQLALFDSQQQALIISLYDTGGTPQGAQAAAQNAIAGGAQLILGPVFADNVRAIAPMVADAQIPSLAFSNDLQARAPAVWLLGFLPEQNIERVARAAIAQGLTRFGALVPEGDYGSRVLAHFSTSVALYGGEVVQTQTYPPEAAAMFDPVRRLAQFEQRRDAHQAALARLISDAQNILPPDAPTDTSTPQKLFAAVGDSAPELVAAYEELTRSETLGEIPYDAIFIPEGGLALRNLAPLLPYFDIDPRLVKFIGTGLWDDSTLAREPSLHGGWYAAPEARHWQSFAQHFEATYQHPPPRLASLAYDGVALAARLATLYAPRPFTPDILTNPNGFAGIDGILRLTADGTNERGLAIYEMTAKTPRLVQTAPANFVEHDRDIRAALALAKNLQAIPTPNTDALNNQRTN